MTISVDKFVINIRHVDNDVVAVKIVDPLTRMLTYNTVNVKELDLDKLEQELINKIKEYKNSDIYAHIFRTEHEPTRLN